MASFTGSAYVGGINLSVTVTYTVTSTATQTTLSITKLDINAPSSGGKIGTVSSVNISGAVSYTYSTAVTGTSKSVSVSKTGTWNRAASDASKSISVSFPCSTRDTSSNTTYNGTGSGSASFTVPALPTYTNTYYPNGGSAISSNTQTHQHGSAFTTKAATVSTRTNYALSKWNTAANGSGTEYNPNASYTVNSNLSLYAQWTQVYATPQVSISRAYRCNSQGNADDEGTYAKVVGTYSIWNTSTTNSVSTASGKVPVCTVNSVSQTAVSGSGDVDNTYSTPIASGNWMSGQFTFKVNADMSTDSSYSVSVSFTDTQGETTGRTTATGTGSTAIGTAFYTIDILEGGHGIAFGGTARDDGVMGLWMPIRQYIGNNYSVAPATDGYFDVLVDYDKAGNQIGYMAINNMTNNVYRSFAVTNPRSSASNKTAGLYLTVRDDGTKSFTTNGVPLAVNSGGTGITDFAEVKYVNGSNVSVANNPTSYARLAAIPLTAGKWLILVGCYAAYAATGARIFTVSSATSVTGVAGRGMTAQLNSAASTCYTSIPWILKLTSDTTYYVYGWQNSGAALNMSAYVIYTKLG